MAWSYPAQESESVCVLCVPAHLVPLVAYSFRDAQQRYKWDSEDDWQAGYYAFAALLGGLMNGCNIGESINELNVMLAHAIGLRNDSTSAADIATFLPATGAALQAAEAADTGDKLTDLSRLVSEQHLLELRGQFPQSWWQGLTNPPEYASLYDLYKTAATNGNIEVTVDGQQKNLWDWVKDNVVGTGSDLVDIVTDIIDVFGTGVDIAGDAAGDVLTGSIEGMTLLALLVQSQILLAVQTDQALTKQRLNDVVEALRGDSATADNILQALRGDVQASAARNVIDRIPDLAATQTALSDLLTAQQATTSAIPDLTTIETALATLDTSQQATTSAINGLTLTADNITIDVTTLETRLDSLIDQVERLRGVTADSAAANVDDVFQELDGLRADVATLMSTADDSNFMQIVDIVENLTETQKELISFRKVFSATNFCCDDTVNTLPPPPDDTTAPQSDHCQRVQWFVDTGLVFLNELAKYKNVPSKLNEATVANLHQLHFNLTIHPLDIASITTSARLLLASGNAMDDAIAAYTTVSGISFNVNMDGDTIANAPGLLCTLYDAPNAAFAHPLVVNDTLSKFFHTSPLTEIQFEQLLLIDMTMSNPDALDALFAGTIPTDPADLTGYDNTACAGCSSSGGGTGDCQDDCSFLAAGTSIDIASSGPYNIAGQSRAIIEWPVGWPANENDSGVQGNVPTTRWVLDTCCVVGLELSFPSDQGSDDTYAISMVNELGDYVGIGGRYGSEGAYTVPSGIRQLWVVRSGSGSPFDRPFTLRVTRPA
jgi:uncharacterized protein (UPF0335 family)